MVSRNRRRETMQWVTLFLNNQRSVASVLFSKLEVTNVAGPQCGQMFIAHVTEIPLSYRAAECAPPKIKGLDNRGYPIPFLGYRSPTPIRR